MKTPKILFILGAAIAALLYPGCRGEQGPAGDAYLSLTWEIVMPMTALPGNPYIPPSGAYGKYYLTEPGVFTLYYDGVVWNGSFYQSYAWTTTYEIHENDGGRGKWFGEQGEKGEDSYLTLVLSPYGPYENRTNKHSILPKGVTLVYEDDNTIEILVHGTAHTMHATYRRTPPRVPSMSAMPNPNQMAH